MRWSKPFKPSPQGKEWTNPPSVRPLIDVAALTAALERYAAHDVRDGSAPGKGSCYDLNETAMAPFADPAPPGSPWVVDAPADGKPVTGVLARATTGTNATTRARPGWTRWPTTC